VERKGRKEKKERKNWLPLFIRQREKLGEKWFVRRWLEEGS
jgi:hypothetical protein